MGLTSSQLYNTPTQRERCRCSYSEDESKNSRLKVSRPGTAFTEVAGIAERNPTRSAIPHGGGGGGGHGAQSHTLPHTERNPTHCPHCGPNRSLPWRCYTNVLRYLEILHQCAAECYLDVVEGHSSAPNEASRGRAQNSPRPLCLC